MIVTISNLGIGVVLVWKTIQYKYTCVVRLVLVCGTRANSILYSVN